MIEIATLVTIGKTNMKFSRLTTISPGILKKYTLGKNKKRTPAITKTKPKIIKKRIILCKIINQYSARH